MPKLPECVGIARLLYETLRERHRCLLNPHNPHIVCAVHPAGLQGNSCLGFRLDPNAEVEELWQPEGASYYNGELIVQPQQRWTREQQLELIDWHPMFTGRCPGAMLSLTGTGQHGCIGIAQSVVGWMIQCERSQFNHNFAFSQ